MLCRVALVRTDVSEELSACFIRMTRIGELGTGRNIPENAILHSHRRKNLKSYKIITSSHKSKLSPLFSKFGTSMLVSELVIMI
jgi:hypothetical protein